MLQFKVQSFYSETVCYVSRMAPDTKEFFDQSAQIMLIKTLTERNCVTELTEG